MDISLFHLCLDILTEIQGKKKGKLSLA